MKAITITGLEPNAPTIAGVACYPEGEPGITGLLVVSFNGFPLAAEKVRLDAFVDGGLRFAVLPQEPKQTPDEGRL